MYLVSQMNLLGFLSCVSCVSITLTLKKTWSYRKNHYLPILTDQQAKMRRRSVLCPESSKNGTGDLRIKSRVRNARTDVGHSIIVIVSNKGNFAFLSIYNLCNLYYLWLKLASNRRGFNDYSLNDFIKGLKKIKD